MIFIPKPHKDPSQPKNYRPISQININGKLYGELLNTRLFSHLDTGNLLDPRQFDFMPGRSTVSSLACSYEYIARKRSARAKTRVALVSRDVSGAFDKVWHALLIKMLAELGLPELFVKTMANFLYDRVITIRIFQHIGAPFIMRAGVPQGAPDSPLLFAISVLPHGFPYDRIRLFCHSSWYADDHHQIVASINPTGLGRHIFHLEEAIDAKILLKRLEV